MEPKTYTITLADGTVLSGLGLNGNNFISADPVDPDIFDGNCTPVVISDGETEETHENMELVQVTQVGDDYWFVLRDLSAAELNEIQMRADIEYIAMMAGIDL